MIILTDPLAVMNRVTGLYNTYPVSFNFAGISIAFLVVSFAVVQILVRTRQRHNAQIAELQTCLSQQAAHVIELEERAERAEKAAHEFAETARYTLESAALVVSTTNRDLHTIAHALPYLYSGRRHWNEQSCPEIAADARVGAQQVTRAYGFELPTDPVEAVKSVLELASMLLVPSHSLPVEGLKIRYPTGSVGQ